MLDDTRIHSEYYGLAQELAREGYKWNTEGHMDGHEDALEMAIEYVSNLPDLLKTYLLDRHIKEKRHENKRETLFLIRRKFVHGFQDWRNHYKEPKVKMKNFI